jgi:hypothetical protein
MSFRSFARPGTSGFTATADEAMVVVRTDLSDRADSEVEIPVIIAGGRQAQTATMCTGHGGENSV